MRSISSNGTNQGNGERGIVLVIVIIIIAVLMILVTDLIYFTQIDTEISTNTRDEIKARYIAKSGVHVAAGTLKARPLEELTTLTAAVGGQSSNADGHWSISVPYFPVGEGNVSVTVTDERSKINLNALVSGSSNNVDQQVLTELTELFRQLDVDDSKSQRFISSLINWTDLPIEGAENDQDLAGANAAFYSSLDPPYRIKDGPLDTLQEIRMIDGMDEEFYNKIKDYVTVHPRDKKINFSTASRVVLIAAIKGASISSVAGQEDNGEQIDDDLAKQLADEIIEARKNDPIMTQNRIRDLAKAADAAEISSGIVGVALGNGESEIFKVWAVGSLGTENRIKRIIEAVIKKTRREQTDVVDFVTWKEL